MTEAEWLAATDPQPMLAFLRGRASERKLRLFAAACCRRIWHLLPGVQSRAWVEAAESLADGREVRIDPNLRDDEGRPSTAQSTARRAALAACLRPPTLAQQEEAVRAWHEAPSDQWYPPARLSEPTAEDRRKAAYEGARKAAESARMAVVQGPGRPGLIRYGRTTSSEQRGQAALLRDVFGNPFGPPPAVDPAWLAWNGGTVRQLAEAAYEQRPAAEGLLDHARLALLADALEDAGCAEPDLLGHLRGPGPHVRGCWAVDLLLGKG